MINVTYALMLSNHWVVCCSVISLCVFWCFRPKRSASKTISKRSLRIRTKSIARRREKDTEKDCCVVEPRDFIVETERRMEASRSYYKEHADERTSSFIVVNR